jgi:hypothetical protein
MSQRGCHGRREASRAGDPLFDIEMDDAAGIRHDSESRKSVNTTGRSTSGWFSFL